MKKLSLFLLLLSICSFTNAQTPNTKFDHNFIKDGLPEFLVSTISQDAEGYIRISTQNGLVQYDGYSYKVYQLGSHALIKTQTQAPGCFIFKL